MHVEDNSSFPRSSIIYFETSKDCISREDCLIGLVRVHTCHCPLLEPKKLQLLSFYGFEIL